MTITAEQAKALKAGITEGPWWSDAKYDDREMGCAVIAARTDSGPPPGNPTRGMVALASELLNTEARRCEANARAIAAVPDMIDTIIAQDARIAELEARENEWRSAFWVSDQFAVAIHDDAGKFYSIRARDFHRMSDLYRGVAAAPTEGGV